MSALSAFSDLFPGGDLSRQNRRNPAAILKLQPFEQPFAAWPCNPKSRRKLQHGSSLAGNQACNLHNLAVREFKRIVMRVRIGHIDLTKACNLVICAHLTEKAEDAVVLDIFVER